MEELKQIIDALRVTFEKTLFKMGEAEITLTTIIQVILVIVVFFLISKYVRKFFHRRILPRFKLDDSVQFVILRLIHFILIIFGILFALNMVGIELTNLAVVFGLIGVGIAFGLQNITSNFVSGVILLFEPSVGVGDYIELGEVIGQVRAINMRSTTIVTRDNITLIVPNSRFIEDTVTNWSVGDLKIRITISVGVAYGSDTELVTRLLLKAADDHPEVLSEPKPDVLFREFGDSSLNFELRVWIPNPNPAVRFKITSDLNYAIDAMFRENNVQIPFPQRDVHLFAENQPSGRGREELSGQWK
jgi:small-conductance mechanosensitive channel